jgi:hypothetical protein
LNQEWRFFNKIKYDSELGLWFVSHAKEGSIEINTGEQQATYGPSCSGAAETYMKQTTDFALFYGRHGEHRAIHVRWDSSIWTACGTSKHFLKNGRPIAAFYIPSPEESGKEVLKAFNNDPSVKVLKYYEPSAIEEDEPEEKKSPKIKKRS